MSKAGKLYDFITNNYYRMSKEDLRIILHEVIYHTCEDLKDQETTYQKIIDTLFNDCMIDVSKDVV